MSQGLKPFSSGTGFTDYTVLPADAGRPRAKAYYRAESQGRREEQVVPAVREEKAYLSQSSQRTQRKAQCFRLAPGDQGQRPILAQSRRDAEKGDDGPAAPVGQGRVNQTRGVLRKAGNGPAAREKTQGQNLKTSFRQDLQEMRRQSRHKGMDENAMQSKVGQPLCPRVMSQVG